MKSKGLGMEKEMQKENSSPKAVHLHMVSGPSVDMPKLSLNSQEKKKNKQKKKIKKIKKIKN